MAVYRFKVTLEEDEDIYRIIEIKSSQNLEELHNAILSAFEFDNKHNAILFISDDYWKKGEKFVHTPDDGDETRSFASIKLNKIINDPHQKLLYTYDMETEWIFLIELNTISINENPKLNYPCCTKIEGKAPKQYKVQRKIGPDLEDDEFSYLTKNLLKSDLDIEVPEETIDLADVPEDALEDDLGGSIGTLDEEDAGSSDFMDEASEEEGADFFEENHDED
jgi:hypothetical protein